MDFPTLAIDRNGRGQTLGGRARMIGLTRWFARDRVDQEKLKTRHAIGGDQTNGAAAWSSRFRNRQFDYGRFRVFPVEILVRKTGPKPGDAGEVLALKNQFRADSSHRA